MEGAWTKKAQNRTRNFWQWLEHAWLYSELLQALKGEHWSALGFQQRVYNFCINSTKLKAVVKNV